MSTKYFALLTQLGADKLANAAALGTKIEITHMAVGDGGGKLPTPDTKQTKLINEKRRAAINTLSIDPKNTNQIIAEQVIPENEGGWWIREIGLYDKDGILIAVGNCAETYKPQLQEGSGRTQTIRMILIVSSANAVTLKVDPSVILATREYVDDSIKKHANSRNHPDATLKEKGFVILSSAVDSNSETHAATPKAVKAAYDLAKAADNNANGRVPAGRKVNGKALSADISLNAGDVGAYSKGETDTKVGEAIKQANAANANANTRVPSTRKVNGKVLSADIALNAGDVGAYSKGETDNKVGEAIKQANAANANANTRVPSTRKVNGKVLSADIALNAGDVGAYSKGETDTKVGEAIKQANAANANANTRVPSTRKVNGKVLSADIALNATDVGAYNTAQTDAKVNEAKALANTANQNAANANNNANTRLEKNKNGADVTDKDAFNRNIGSGRAFSGEVPIGGGGSWTTDEFIAWLKSKGAFNHPYWMCKGTWAYAHNKMITDTGCGSIHLAGAVVEVMGIESVMTIRVTTAPTSVNGCIENAQFTYGNHGKDYHPSWRRDYNTANKPTAGDVGAYSKDETDVRVNEAKAQANAANENANTRLEKSKNGADIPNKNEFVKNLGLIDTVNLAKNSVPNSRKINGKALTGDVALSAEDVQGEPRFNTTIDLTRLSSDRYYPVWWRFPSNDGANSWLTIHRWYAEDREKEPFGKGVTHLAGLSLQIEGGDVPWGGDAHYLNIKRIRQTYRNTVKNIRHGMMCIARPIDGKYPLYQGAKPGDIVTCYTRSGCYLRGGLTYHVTSNFSGIHYSREEGEIEVDNSLQSHNNFEIKWTAKSYAIDDPVLGKDYDDVVTPYAYDLVDILYPLGVVVWFAQNKNPNSLFPKTQWKYIGENKTIRLANQNGSNVFAVGGNDSITLTGAQIPTHNHSFSATTSSFDYGVKSTNSNGSHFHDSGWGESNIDSARYGVYDNTRGNTGSGDTDRDNYKYKTSTEGAHTHTVHIGAHTHSVSGTTGNTGGNSAINITNSYVMLMGWYRTA
ncbi:phage tail protein [Xenorhabdus griffiniae]|uniref:phage tail protein n=1 Tax=Xenorhabdus griffiniae TaxID=351672 RepID=UPI0030CEC13E